MDLPPASHEDETVVFSSTDRSAVDACMLVLAARHIAHQARTEGDGTTVILVATDSAPRARAEINLYFQENRGWPPRDVLPDVHSSPARPPAILIVGALAAFYLVTGPWDTQSPWFAGGAGDASAIIYRGEWYRLVTALTLHADFAHLAGNVLVGGFLLYFFLQLHGTGLGLLAVLLSALLGNHLNVQLHGGSHLFVGFSTAVFSMIGMLAAHQVIVRRSPFGIRLFAPFLAGAALLALLGSSGERTDLGGHLFGLLAGCGCGLVLSLPPVRQASKSRFLQHCALLATLFLLLVCWNLALAPRSL